MKLSSVKKAMHLAASRTSILSLAYDAPFADRYGITDMSREASSRESSQASVGLVGVPSNLDRMQISGVPVWKTRLLMMVCCTRSWRGSSDEATMTSFVMGKVMVGMKFIRNLHQHERIGLSRPLRLHGRQEQLVVDL